MFPFIRKPALAAALLFALPTAWACTDDNPPSDDPAECDVAPSAADIAPFATAPGSDSYHGGTLVSFGEQSVGACDTPKAYLPIHCEDPRATCETATHTCKIKFLGVIYKPVTTKPAAGYPAMMLVDGSQKCSPNFPTTCVYQPQTYNAFTIQALKKGFVVFQPFPRGYGISPTRKSSGLYVGDLAPKQVARGEGCSLEDPQFPASACTARDLRDEGQQDVRAGLAFLKSRTFVDITKLAALGYSYGGIRVTSLNVLDVGLKVVMAPAAASESWCGSQVLRTQLINSAAVGRVPAYTFQTQNDVNLASSVEMAHAAGMNKHQLESSIFPRATDVHGVPFQFGNHAHGCFAGQTKSVNLWGPTVFEFMARYGVK